MGADVSRMYINGQWIEAEDGATFDVVNPATREVVARVANGGIAETRRALDAAHAAFKEWSNLPPKERGKILHRIQDGMERELDAIAKLIVQENGKPFEEAKKEVAFALGYFGWFAEEARRV